MKKMASFQTQSQWENENLPDIEYNIDSGNDSSLKKNNNRIKIRKSTLLIIASSMIVIVALLLSVYIAARPIEGVWIRQMDDNSTLAGMTVEVRKNGGVTEGVIITMPEGAEEFEVGQVKWFDIQKVGFGKYQFRDLTYSGNTETYYYRNSDSDLLSVMSGGKRLTISCSDRTQRDKGAFQVWIKND